MGWLGLTTVIDCHTRAVVGWSMAGRMHLSLLTDEEVASRVLGPDPEER